MAEDMSNFKSSRAGRVLKPSVKENFVTFHIRRPKRRCPSPPCSVPPVASILPSDTNDAILWHSAKRAKAAQNIARQTSDITQPSVMVTDQFAEPDYRIALDFGTTYTSIAFVQKGDPKIYSIDQWDADHCQQSNWRQVPTESVYLSNSRRHGYEAQRWPEDPQHNGTVIAHIKRMKLLLDDTGSTWTRDAKNDVSKRVRKLKAHRLIDSEQDIIRHILRYYFDHIKLTLERTYSFNDGKSGME
jgi:hypothetical protein